MFQGRFGEWLKMLLINYSNKGWSRVGSLPVEVVSTEGSFPPREHLAASGDIFACHNLGASLQWTDAGDTANYPHNA